MSERIRNSPTNQRAQGVDEGRLIPGKRVRGDLYIHVDALAAMPPDFQERVTRASSIVNVPLSEVSVIRFSLVANELSLLDYPTFFEEPFPTLARSWTVRLDAEGGFRFRGYVDSLNPPILHRKELLLPSNHPRREEFSEITAAAEAIGLFDSPATIGFKSSWERLIAKKGYRLEGGRFAPISSGGSIADANAAGLDIARHLTALTRYNFSAPVQTLARFGFFSRGWTFFDYGCGKGDDVRGLRENGVAADGWDPYFAHDVSKKPADIVNLGFVINVIEDVLERKEALRQAFRLATRVLSVSVMLYSSANPTRRVFGDGYLSDRGTFQKYFTQAELKEFIDDTLGEESVLVAPGVAFIFMDKEEEQRFLFARQRTDRSLLRLTARVRPERAPQLRRTTKPDVYVANLAQFTALWHRWLSLGRIAEREEAQEFETLFSNVGSFQRTCKILTERQDQSLLVSAGEERQNDLLVYFALQRFARRKPYRQLDRCIQRDVKIFFGVLRSCEERSDALLHQIADREQIEAACCSASEKGLGHYLPGRSLILHSSLVPRLPPILRVYVGAAGALYGDVSTADLVKIHVRSSKLTLLEFDSFQDSPVPKIHRRVKIKLRSQEFDLFEYGALFEPTVLLGKSRFINEEFPRYAEQLEFDTTLKETGLFAWDEHGPTESEFDRVLGATRRAIKGYLLTRASTIPSLDEPCGRYFRYRDLVECGDTQRETGIPNLPREPETFNSLFDLATEILDPVVEYFGMIKLTYGFASPELIRAISRQIAPERDQHVSAERNRAGKIICARGGAAVDFLVEDEDMFEVARWIAENLRFDRLYVYGTNLPIHVSFGPEHSREITFVERRGSKVTPRRIPSPADISTLCQANAANLS